MIIYSYVIQAPCKANGTVCTERHLGCQGNCERFAEYKLKLQEFKRTVLEAKRRTQIVEDYNTDTKTKLLHGKKYER